MLDGTKLERGLQVRGMNLSELAALTGLSSTTVASALAGKAVNMTTALAVVQALKGRPIVEGLDELVWMAPALAENTVLGPGRTSGQ